MKIALLISPHTKAAFFREYLSISKIEVLGFLVRTVKTLKYKQKVLEEWIFFMLTCKKKLYRT